MEGQLCNLLTIIKTTLHHFPFLSLTHIISAFNDIQFTDLNNCQKKKKKGTIAVWLRCEHVHLSETVLTDLKMSAEVLLIDIFVFC